MKKIQWEKQVPIFQNRFILKDLLIALGIPFGLLIIILVVLSHGDIFGTDVKYALFLIALLFLLTFFFVIVIYNGMYAPGFIINEKGITNYTQSMQRKKNRVINGLLILLGFFSRNPGAIGMGLLAEGKQCIKIDWKHIRKVQYYPDSNTILVKGDLTQKIVLFCTAENYKQVEEIVKNHISS
jgi:hypothetical protein